MISCGTHSSSCWMSAKAHIVSAVLFFVLLITHQGRCATLKGQKAVFQLNAPDEYGTMSPGTNIPPLDSFTLCIDIRLRQNNIKGMTAFTYNTDTKRIPSNPNHDLGIMVINRKLIILLFHQRINVEKNISLANWHSLCLTWNGKAHKTYIYVNKTEVLSKTLNSYYKLGQNGSLVLGRKHSREPDRLRVDPETFVGDLYLFRLWDHAKGREAISQLNCEDGNVINWDSEQWDFSGSILEYDDSLPCCQWFHKSRFKRSDYEQYNARKGRRLFEKQEDYSGSISFSDESSSDKTDEEDAMSSTPPPLGITSDNVITSSLPSTTAKRNTVAVTTSAEDTRVKRTTVAVTPSAESTRADMTFASETSFPRNTTDNSTISIPTPRVTVNSTIDHMISSPQNTRVNSTVGNVKPSAQYTTANSTIGNNASTPQPTTVNYFSTMTNTPVSANSTSIHDSSPAQTTTGSSFSNTTSSSITANSTSIDEPSPAQTTTGNPMTNVTTSPVTEVSFTTMTTTSVTGNSFSNMTSSSITGNSFSNMTSSPITANSTSIHEPSSAQTTTENPMTNVTTSPVTANSTSIHEPSSAQITTGNPLSNVSTSPVTEVSFTTMTSTSVTGNSFSNVTSSSITANSTSIHEPSSAQITTGNSFSNMTSSSITANSTSIHEPSSAQTTTGKPLTNVTTSPVTGNSFSNMTGSSITANSTSIHDPSPAQTTTELAFPTMTNTSVTGKPLTNMTTSLVTANSTSIHDPSPAQTTTGVSFTPMATTSVTANNTSIYEPSPAQTTTGNPLTNVITSLVTGNSFSNVTGSSLTANSTSIHDPSPAQNKTGNPLTSATTLPVTGVSFTIVTTTSVTGNSFSNMTTSSLTANSTSIHEPSPAQTTTANSTISNNASTPQPTTGVSFITRTTTPVTGNSYTKVTTSPVTANSTISNNASTAQPTPGASFSTRTITPVTANTTVNGTSTPQNTTVTMTIIPATSTPQITTEYPIQINSTELNETEVLLIVNQLENILQLESINEELAKSLLNTVGILINVSPAAVASSSRRIIQIVDQIGEKLNFTSTSINITATSLALAVTKVNATNFSGAYFSISNITNLQVNLGEESPQKNFAAIELPPSLLKDLSPEERNNASKIQFTFYEKLTLFQDPSLGNTSFINSYIIASSVASLNISDLEDPVQITFRNIQNNQNNSYVECVFWDFKENNGNGGWNSNGCNTIHNKSNETICECNHLTHFGVLLIISRDKIDPIQNRILTFITYIGCGISSICLAITLVTYLLFEKLRKDYPSKILMNLCTALLLLNMVFLIDSWISTYGIEGLCIAVAVFLHYFLLVSFTWMSLEAVHMYLALVKVFNTYVRRYILKFCILGWGIPLVVVAIIVGSKPENYGFGKYDKGTNSSLDTFCWIQNDVVFYIAAVGYFCVMFLINLSMFIVVLIQLCRIKNKKQHQNAQRSVFQDMKSVAGLTFLLGITWGFGFFAWGPVNLPFMYLFAIFNTLQGTFIFIFHCATKENVQKQWRRYLCCGKFRLAENSDWSRTATNNTKKLQPLVQAMSLSSSSNNSLQANSSLYQIQDYSHRPIVNGSFDGKTDDRIPVVFTQYLLN